MKSIAYCIILMSFILTSGCVSRTVTESKGAQSPNSSPTSKVIDKKLIWFWQDDFRKP